MKRHLTFCAALAAATMLAGASHATILGFGQLGGSNTAVPGGYGSNAVADASGLVVSNGATPNIALTWDANWDIHTSNFFSGIEAQTVGGGAWDNEGSIPRVGQLDFGAHSTVFTVDPGYQLVLNSFDFGHTGETPGTTVWDLALTDSSANVAWSQTVTFLNGMVQTFSPGFTGLPGEDYTLTFNRTSETYNSNGRHGLDNLSFNQAQVPEPSACVLAGLGVLGVVAGVRRR